MKGVRAVQARRERHRLARIGHKSRRLRYFDAVFSARMLSALGLGGFL